MLRKIFAYGTAAGLIVGGLLSFVTLSFKDHPPTSYGMAIGYSIMLVGLSLVFTAIKRHRDIDLGGVIRFWPAFGLGLGISVVASVLYVICWEGSVAAMGIDFGASYAHQVIEEAKAKGMSGDALAKFTAQMDDFQRQYANPLFRWPMTFAEIFPVGVLVSLVSAGLLCNRRFLALRRA